jgi:nucleoside phosphorylase/energy-coupling factor transporter ATP-binding protein EcfA2
MDPQAKTQQEQPRHRRAVILTALRAEYVAVRAQFEKLTNHIIAELVSPNGTVYEQGIFDAQTVSWEVNLVEIGVGNADAALQTYHALSYFQPEVVLVVGVAAGVSGELVVGDVVVATKVYAYEESKAGEEYELLPALSIASSYALEQRARAEAKRGNWSARVNKNATRPPSVYLAPIGMVRQIVRDYSKPYGALRSHAPDVVAVEMESYGFLSAAKAYSSSETLMVRGISQVLAIDFERWQPSDIELAADNAAAFAFRVLERFVPSEQHAARSSTQPVNSPRNRVYLQQVVVHNIRSLRVLDWHIPPGQATGWHVIIGNNGSGKTSFLRSIALALMSEDDVQALRQDWDTWLRKECAEGEVILTLERQGDEFKRLPERSSETHLLFKRVVSTEHSGAALAQPVSHRREGPSLALFSAAYGPFRRFSGGDPDLERELAPYPLALRHFTLFSERVALTESLSWLRYLDHRRYERHPEGEFLNALTEFINQPGFLPHATKLHALSSKSVTFVDGNGCVIEVEELSDGFRSILSLTLELLRQLVSAFGPEGVFAPRDPTRVIASGIVLIDEVDTHLHPTWQRDVGIWFQEHFPNIQFIVTSHSPLVCQAAERGTVFLLPRPGTEEEGRMLSGVELDRVRYGNVLDAYGTGVFGQGVTRSESSKQMLQTLAQLNQKELEEELTAEELAEQERLRRIFPTTAHTLNGREPGPRQ